jgi:peptidyl-prolyl cis-trans isomerase B (cyclophilin B)
MRDKLITVFAGAAVLALVVIFNTYYRQGAGPAPAPARNFAAEANAQTETGGKMIAVVETNKGAFKFELLPEVAPGTVANFVKLANKGFYDGTIFHRVIPGFMMQGGDPEGTGRGGPGYTVKAEFSKRKHVAGTVSMARSAHPDSAGSQFYVCFAPAPHLDGQYTIFGQVTEGMDVVKEIEKVKTDRSDRPLEEIVMKKVQIIEEASDQTKADAKTGK